MPALSVLIPVRNAALTVDEALASIAAQTFTDWEALLVDDGSTDDSGQRLQAWARRDSRFRVLRGRGSGIVAALNQALAEARATVLARMDADDLSLPQRFALQMARLAAGDVSAVGCRVRFFPDHRVADGARRYESWLNSLLTPEEHDRDLFVECPLAHPSMLLRAAAVREVGGYQAHGWPEDYDLLFRLWMAGHRLAKCPQELLLWREGEGRTSRTHPDYTPEAFYRCKAHYLARTHLRDGVPAVVFGAGPVGKAIARAVLTEGARLLAFVDVDPRRIGQRIHGAPVLDQQTGFRLRGQAFGLAAMGRPEARAELRDALLRAGWKEKTEFRCVS
ncbi:MAG TPA: glycosyltransferase [Armatimonadota bacterium]|nr:glycosyltransferase [Armatimonadota bacterium]